MAEDRSGSNMIGQVVGGRTSAWRGDGTSSSSSLSDHTMMMIGSPFYSQKFAVRTITLLSVDPCIGHCEDLDSEGGKKPLEALSREVVGFHQAIKGSV